MTFQIESAALKELRFELVKGVVEVELEYGVQNGTLVLTDVGDGPTDEEVTVDDEESDDADGDEVMVTLCSRK